MADTDHLGRPIVVVTGTGIITSLGQGQAENWRALTNGVSGIHRISRFPIGGLRTTIAGTVDFRFLCRNLPLPPTRSVLPSW